MLFCVRERVGRRKKKVKRDDLVGVFFFFFLVSFLRFFEKNERELTNNILEKMMERKRREGVASMPREKCEDTQKNANTDRKKSRIAPHAHKTKKKRGAKHAGVRAHECV